MNPRDRFSLVAIPTSARLANFARDVESGLTASPKQLPCCYFYDREGSFLFEDICELPEYYLTRAEASILREQAAHIAGLFPVAPTLVELGSGNATKTRILLEAFLSLPRDARGANATPLHYVPIDICRTILEDSSLELLRAYPQLEILAVAGEYQEGLQHMQRSATRTKLVLWLGSNIGNFERREAADFLRKVRDTLSPGDRLLVGIDLRKDRAVLEPAYDDARGVTAEFNKNILARINRELNGHFDLETFQHRAIYNEPEGRIEMYLVSTRLQHVAIEHLGIVVPFAAGEAIHTENSYKYSPDEIDELAGRAGLCTEKQWLDAEKKFSVNLFSPAR